MRIRAALSVCATTLALAMPLSSYAQTQEIVTLKSYDGFTQLRGVLQNFDGSTFTIETALGVITVDGSIVTCEGDACPQNQLFGAEFGIEGSITIGAELMPALIEGYSDSLEARLISEVGQDPLDRTLRVIHEDGREMAAIRLSSRGSTSSYDGLALGNAAIGMSARRARDRDMDVLARAGFEDLRDTPNEHVLGLDALVVVVHQSNPIRSISMSDLAAVFSGQITRWSELGGTDDPINVYSRGEDSSTLQTFGSLVLAPFNVDLSPSARLANSNAEVSDIVSNDPAGIGVTSLSSQRATKSLAIRQDCGLLTEPTSFAMKAEEYPLSRRLYLYTLGDSAPAHARQLVEYAQTREAQGIIADTGFVNNEIERISLAGQGERLIHAIVGENELQIEALQQLLRQLQDAERMSITFRFAAGGGTLTQKSLREAEAFAAALANGAYDGKEVLLVGFTDSVGQFALNQALSEARAATVEQLLLDVAGPEALSGVALSTSGFGELTPVGCNTTPQGRSANRRVEVWIRDLS